jgi:hypothetical protein
MMPAIIPDATSLRAGDPFSRGNPLTEKVESWADAQQIANKRHTGRNFLITVLEFDEGRNDAGVFPLIEELTALIDSPA